METKFIKSSTKETKKGILKQSKKIIWVELLSQNNNIRGQLHKVGLNNGNTSFAVEYLIMENNYTQKHLNLILKQNLPNTLQDGPFE